MIQLRSPHRALSPNVHIMFFILVFFFKLQISYLLLLDQHQPLKKEQYPNFGKVYKCQKQEQVEE